MSTGHTLFEKPTVIINSAAGSTSNITKDVTRIFEKYGYSDLNILFIKPTELTTAFEKIKTDGTDLLVIYGGDGTCKAGALIARKNDIVFLPLPGGTMNLLPKSLYGTDDWKVVLHIALQQKTARWQAAGNINGNVFFCGAIIGDPIVMSEARESLRDGELIEAAKQIPEIMTSITHGEEFEFKIDGKIFDRDANALQILCPMIGDLSINTDKFDVISLPQLSFTDLVGIGVHAVSQDFRKSSLIKEALANDIEINGQGEFDVLLDGEPERVECPIHITLEAKGVRVLAPHHTDPVLT